MSQLSFSYRAIDKAGVTASGVIRAATKQDAYRRITATGLTPTRIAPYAGGERLSLLDRFRRRVRPQEIAHFTYQLSVLLEARIPVVDCFSSIAQQEPNPVFRRIILDIATGVQSGKNITDALSMHRHLFGDVYLETVRAAEAGGNMIKVLGHLAEQVEDATEMRRMVKSALMYPVTVIVALLAGSGFLVTFVVPRFAEMFRARGVKLPVLTEALDAVGTSVKSWWFLYLGCLILGGIVARSLWARPGVRSLADRLLHRVPYLNGVLTGLAVGRFASVFGLCLSSGLGLIDSLQMSGKATGRPMLMDDAALLIQQVKGGGRLGDALQRCSYMPGFVKQLLRAGEESAEMNKMCAIVARHYSRETKHMVKNAATVIEPLLIALLTGVVMVIALAIFLPMWNMVSLMQ